MGHKVLIPLLSYKIQPKAASNYFLMETTLSNRRGFLSEPLVCSCHLTLSMLFFLSCDLFCIRNYQGQFQFHLILIWHLTVCNSVVPMRSHFYLILLSYIFNKILIQRPRVILISLTISNIVPFNKLLLNKWGKVYHNDDFHWRLADEFCSLSTLSLKNPWISVIITFRTSLEVPWGQWVHLPDPWAIANAQWVYTDEDRDYGEESLMPAPALSESPLSTFLNKTKQKHGAFELSALWNAGKLGVCCNICSFYISKQIEQLKQKADKRVRSVSKNFAMILVSFSFCQALPFCIVFRIASE